MPGRRREGSRRVRRRSPRLDARLRLRLALLRRMRERHCLGVSCVLGLRVHDAGVRRSLLREAGEGVGAAQGAAVGAAVHEEASVQLAVPALALPLVQRRLQ
jgi:hypothetical protein